jgi:hypothetical protein
LRISFEIWNSQQSWFWFVENTNRNGMIGAAGSESEAEREARSSIEELANPNRADWESAPGDLVRYLATPGRAAGLSTGGRLRRSSGVTGNEPDASGHTSSKFRQV